MFAVGAATASVGVVVGGRKGINVSLDGSVGAGPATDNGALNSAV